MMGAFGGMGNWGWGPGMGFGWITVLGLIVWGLLGVTRRWRADPEGRGATWIRPVDRSLAMLNERYAQGEVDTETYRRMRSKLEG